MSPLVLPLWVQLNIYFGVAMLWILAPLVYYFNVWDAQSFPFMSNSIFQLLPNGTSVIYPQRQVLGSDNVLNQTALEEIGRPYYSAIGAVSYVFINFAVTASIAHIALYHGKTISKTFKASFRELSDRIRGSNNSDQQPSRQETDPPMDPHMRMMSFYKEVTYSIVDINELAHICYKKAPTWWYYVVYFGGIALNIAIAYVNKSQLPWWGVILAIVMSTVLSLPLNMITAITGTGFGLNVFAEMICGFVLPGLPGL
jgi:hypothetical protein